MHLIDVLKKRIAPSVGSNHSDRPADAALSLRGFADDIERVLREIDFEEVSVEDRIAFVQAAVDWQVRCALERGRFDAVVRLRQFEREQIARFQTDPGVAWRRSRG